jgi:hypothetical protein
MSAHASSRIAGTRNHARTMPASAEALVPREAPRSRDIGSKDRGRSEKNLVVLVGAGIQEARLRTWMAQRPVREARRLRSLEDLPHAQVPENTVRVLLMRRRQASVDTLGTPGSVRRTGTGRPDRPGGSADGLTPHWTVRTCRVNREGTPRLKRRGRGRDAPSASRMTATSSCGKGSTGRHGHAAGRS